MLIFFRVDSSLLMGTGHMMRCLTLASYIERYGFKVKFIMRKHAGNMIGELKNRNIEYKLLPKPHNNSLLGVSEVEDANQCLKFIGKNKPDWLIVDHYGIGITWHNLIKPNVKKLMVIDDVGKKYINCDLLLNQNFGVNTNIYKDLIPKNTCTLIGAEYSLLRRRFKELREIAIKKRSTKSKFNNILITLGGLDSENLTQKILSKLEKINWVDMPNITIILGESAPNYESLNTTRQNYKFSIELKKNIENMADYMLKADISIGAYGSTTWERCCLGLPALCFTMADNQKQIAKSLSKIKAVEYLGNSSDSQSLEKLSELLPMKNQLAKSLSYNSLSIVDGNGCSRVLNVLLNQK